MPRAPRDKFTLLQDIVGGHFVKISTERIDGDELHADSLDVFAHDLPLGVSPGYSEHGNLAALAICDDQNCRIIQFKYSRSGPKVPRGFAALLDKVFCRPSGDIVAFDMAPLAMSLYSIFRLRVLNAVDIQSGFPMASRDPLTSILKIMGKSTHVDEREVEQRFRELVLPDDIDLATRAWISQFLVTSKKGPGLLARVPRINTKDVDEHKLAMLAKLSADALRLDIKKPTQTTHPVNVRTNLLSQDTQLESVSYSSRVRPDKELIVRTSNATGTFNVHGSVGWSDGRMNSAETSRPLGDAIGLTVTSIGRDDPTTAEAHRASTLLRILQGAYDLLDNPWIQNVWLQQGDVSFPWPGDWAPPPSSFKPGTSLSLLPLNASQQTAVNTMLSYSHSHHITLIQGPPGTGKTSVIASYVQLSLAYGRTGIWIVAQSNVAIKNVAEKLIKAGFHNWKLLVSKTFHFGWHEHLYSTLESHVLRSDEFLESADSNKLMDIPVILCTLSMLSNKHVRSTFTTIVPLNYLIVDEASQIEVGNFATTFIDFKSTLRKVCFIGDAKQLPPHGQEDIKDLQSIFEFPHLNKPEKVVFLNIQYRMPPEIGRFISQSVYGGRLMSSESHPVQGFLTCKFIDAGGKEYMSNGSYENKAECHTVIKIAHRLQKHNKSYHILTPYTGQHYLIERDMKKVQGLAWEDKCFTVDSFQGHEDDYIIISIVRSLEIGFLKNLRRTNVMLTRCRRGMFIISSQNFCQGPGADSLVGKMSKGRALVIRSMPKEIVSYH